MFPFLAHFLEHLQSAMKWGTEPASRKTTINLLKWFKFTIINCGVSCTCKREKPNEI